MSHTYIVYRPEAKPLADRLLQQYEAGFINLQVEPFLHWECTAIQTDEVAIVDESRMADFLFKLGNHDAKGGYHEWLRQLD